MAKKKTGRPEIYTQDLADILCARIAEGVSVRTVCAMEDMPCTSTFFKWIRENKEFLQQYVQAKEASVDAQHEILEDIGDEAIGKAQVVDARASNAVVSAYKLKADNLKWLMSKMKPKKYGDKVDLTSGGEKLPTPILQNLNVPNNNSDKENIESEEED